MIPQPYPLFYGRLDGDDRQTGRIIGWRQDGELTRPVVLLHNPDGTTGQVRLMPLDDDVPSWVRDAEDDLTAAFELHEKLNRIRDLTE